MALLRRGLSKPTQKLPWKVFSSRGARCHGCVPLLKLQGRQHRRVSIMLLPRVTHTINSLSVAMQICDLRCLYLTRDRACLPSKQVQRSFGESVSRTSQRITADHTSTSSTSPNGLLLWNAGSTTPSAPSRRCDFGYRTGEHCAHLCIL